MALARRVELDPIFGLRTPLLFAHRGGAGEVPESTEEAFRHAVLHHTDVLELDVRLTADGEIVVWHGPGLGNVHDGHALYKRSDRIHQFPWSSRLQGSAFVVHPLSPGVLGTERGRLLLTLADFLGILLPRLDEQAGRPLPINIEAKRSSGPRWSEPLPDGTVPAERLLDLLYHEAERRQVLLASGDHARLMDLKRRMEKRARVLPTCLSLMEQLAYSEHFDPASGELAEHLESLLRLVQLFLHEEKHLEGRAFETSHGLVTEELVALVRKRGGETHVFLTDFPGLPAIDDAPEDVLREALFALLDKGVDGIMTDYPSRVRPLLQEWIAAHPL